LKRSSASCSWQSASASALASAAGLSSIPRIGLLWLDGYASAELASAQLVETDAAASLSLASVAEFGLLAS
jgi:hypothetical protein